METARMWALLGMVVAREWRIGRGSIAAALENVFDLAIGQEIFLIDWGAGGGVCDICCDGSGWGNGTLDWSPSRCVRVAAIAFRNFNVGGARGPACLNRSFDSRAFISV